MKHPIKQNVYLCVQAIKLGLLSKLCNKLRKLHVKAHSINFTVEIKNFNHRTSKSYSLKYISPMSLIKYLRSTSVAVLHIEINENISFLISFFVHSIHASFGIFLVHVVVYFRQNVNLQRNNYSL